MAGLPHFRNSKAAVNKWEPLYPNMFEVTILPPPSVSGYELFLEHVNKIGGIDIELGEAITEQKYKFATRSYLNGLPEKTTVDLVVNFSLNFNDENELYLYNTLVDWKRRGYNPETGEMGLKKDYVGNSIVVNQFNRIGDIWRTITFGNPIIVEGLKLPEELDYANAELATIDVTFRCDFWNEKVIGRK